MNYAPEISEDVLVQEETQDSTSRSIVVFNDDINTFDHVIDTLVDVCRHTPEQAEQCTILIHHKGKCSVKEGSYSELEAMCTSICERGISAEVA